MARSLNPQKQIDWVQADDTTGTHVGLAEELLLKLLEGLPETQLLFQADYAREDWKSLEEHTHKLHGACYYCGVPILKHAVQVLERATRNNPSPDRIKPKLNAFHRSVDRLFAEAAVDPRLLKAKQQYKS